MDESKKEPKLQFYGGRWVTFVPLLMSLVILFWIAINNGNVPVYWAAFLVPLMVCVFLAKDKYEYCEAIVRGIVDPVGGMLFISIILAGICGIIISDSGMVDSLAQLVVNIDLVGNKFVAATFVISCLIGFATGTVIGTIFIVGPILYPVGCLVGGTPALLLGAIISGGAFGDDFAPISETIIACSSTQKVNMGVLFKSRAKYVLPVTFVTLVLYLFLGSGAGTDVANTELELNPAAFLFLLIPVIIIVACLLQRHLVEALSYGILAGILIGGFTGLVPFSQVITIPEPFGAGGIIVDGIDDAAPTVFVTMFLFAHIEILNEGGGTDIILNWVERFVKGPRSCEAAISIVTIVLNVVTGLNSAAIMGCAPIAEKLGDKYGVNACRRSNLLICSGATFNYIVPYMVPTVCGVMVSANYAPDGFSAVSAIEIVGGEFYPWLTLAILIIAIVSGYGRTFLPDPDGRLPEQASQQQ